MTEVRLDQARQPRAAVIGDPIAHSLSPALFRELSAALERPLLFHRLRLTAAEFPRALAAVKREGPPWLGWTVTIPHKLLAYELADRLEPSARAAGAVNCLHFTGGAAVGHNTDGAGFLAPLDRLGIPLQGLRALLLGAGGAARAVARALADSGAAPIVVLNRTPARAEELAAAVGGRGGALTPEAVAAELPPADLVVQCSPLGMDGRSSPLPPGARFKPGALAYDLVYRPAETPFLKAARAAGARTLGGLEMLLAQAAAAWRVWFGAAVPEPALARARRALERRLAA